MRLSRPCYDKPRRCPGWIGGGMLYPKRDRCKGGYLVNQYNRGWRWRFHRCNSCDVLVLPQVVEWVDWRWWRSTLRHLPGRLRSRWGWRQEMRARRRRGSR